MDPFAKFYRAIRGWKPPKIIDTLSFEKVGGLYVIRSDTGWIGQLMNETTSHSVCSLWTAIEDGAAWPTHQHPFWESTHVLEGRLVCVNQGKDYAADSVYPCFTDGPYKEHQFEAEKGTRLSVVFPSAERYGDFGCKVVRNG